MAGLCIEVADASYVVTDVLVRLVAVDAHGSSVVAASLVAFVERVPALRHEDALARGQFGVWAVDRGRGRERRCARCVDELEQLASAAGVLVRVRERAAVGRAVAWLRAADAHGGRG